MKKLPVNLKASDRIVEFIKKHEAFRAKMYLCQAGHPTIGYGHKILKTEKHLLTASLTVAEAVELLRKDIAIAEAGVKRLYTASLTQGMFDALVSLVYNTGAEKLKGMGVVTKVNRGSTLKDIAASFLAWNKVTDPKTGKLVVSNGLTKRRNDEWAIFIS